MDVQQLMGIHRKAISCASGDESSVSDSVRGEGMLDFIIMRAESRETPDTSSESPTEYLAYNPVLIDSIQRMHSSRKLDLISTNLI